MSQGLDMTVNSLPSRTWNWLKMNESKLKEIEAGDTWDVKEVAGESKEIACLTEDAAENQEVFSHIHTGMGICTASCIRRNTTAVLFPFKCTRRRTV